MHRCQGSERDRLRGLHGPSSTSEVLIPNSKVTGASLWLSDCSVWRRSYPRACKTDFLSSNLGLGSTDLHHYHIPRACVFLGSQFPSVLTVLNEVGIGFGSVLLTEVNQGIPSVGPPASCYRDVTQLGVVIYKGNSNQC